MTRQQILLRDEHSPPVKQIKVANNKTLLVGSSGDVILDTMNGESQTNKILFSNVL